MPRSDHPHVLRLYSSLAEHAGAQAAERFAAGFPLSKSADFAKKFDWAQAVCAELEREFPGEQVRQIRMDCACGPERGKISRLKKEYEKSQDMAEFAARASQLELGFAIAWEDGSLYLLYPRCYCSCVKRVEQPVPRSWCDCSLGYAKRMFEAILDRLVQAELIESVKTGGKRCRIRIFGI